MFTHRGSHQHSCCSDFRCDQHRCTIGSNMKLDAVHSDSDKAAHHFHRLRFCDRDNVPLHHRRISADRPNLPYTLVPCDKTRVGRILARK